MSNIVDILLRAKDATSTAFVTASSRIKKFGSENAKSLKNLGAAFKKIGVAAVAGFGAVGTAMVAAARRAEEFNKQIGQIATLTDISTSEIKSQVRSMSAEFGLAKDELTKGLYDALSAGVPKDNVFEFMKVSAKGAIAGAASTAEAVDILTTAMNSFKIPATDAEKVSDALFTTVRLGKTTLSELSESFATVGPIASSSGVAIEEVLAATASLTKQGVPTSQAMTQIRGAIIAMNRELGDGWSKTMTLQEGMQAMADKAGGSQNALKELTGRVEGMNAILGVTGENAAGAADDLAQLTASAGATDEAFGKMEGTHAFAKMMQTLDNAVTMFGDVVLLAFGKQIGSSQEDLQAWLETFDAEKIDRVAMQLAIFATTATTTALNIGDAFTRVFTGLGDTITAPFAYAGEVIGAFINGTIEQLKYLKAYAKAVGDKIANPFSKFQSPDGSMAAGSFKEFGDALGGRAFRNAGKGDRDLIGRIEERQRKEAEAIEKITDLYHKRQTANQKTQEDTQTKAVGSIADAKKDAESKVASDVSDVEADLTTDNLDEKLAVATDNVEEIADTEHELDMVNVAAKKDAEIDAAKEVAQARAAIDQDYGGSGGDPSDRNYNLTAVIQARDMAEAQGQAMAEAMRDVMIEANAPMIEQLRAINENTKMTAETIKDAITMSD